MKQGKLHREALEHFSRSSTDFSQYFILGN